MQIVLGIVVWGLARWKTFHCHSRLSLDSDNIAESWAWIWELEGDENRSKHCKFSHGKSNLELCVSWKRGRRKISGVIWGSHTGEAQESKIPGGKILPPGPALPASPGCSECPWLCFPLRNDHPRAVEGWPSTAEFAGAGGSCRDLGGSSPMALPGHAGISASQLRKSPAH